MALFNVAGIMTFLAGLIMAGIIANIYFKWVNNPKPTDVRVLVKSRDLNPDKLKEEQ